MRSPRQSGILVQPIRLKDCAAGSAISIVENEITTNEKEITRLQQEKNELSKADRIKQIAEKLGLSINDDNLRKVK